MMRFTKDQTVSVLVEGLDTLRYVTSAIPGLRFGRIIPSPGGSGLLLPLRGPQKYGAGQTARDIQTL
jgi:hypothetical protein